MTYLALIRHGATEWNRKGLIQGHTDISLDDGGRAEVAGWTIPAELAGFHWISSPFERALETAEILSGVRPPTDARLGEMAWGDWEGRTLADLRAELGEEMAAREAKGLDFKAPGGESPREVQIRVQPLLAEIFAAGEDTVAVCHKGVIRAIYALAADWNMLGKPPEKLRNGCVQVFTLDETGHPSPHRLNLEMNGS